MKQFRKMKDKHGFTLAEMLIVIALLAIIMAIAAPNVAKYSKSIKLRELNDSARSIYMAAEHKFASDVEMGADPANPLGFKEDEEYFGIMPKMPTTRYNNNGGTPAYTGEMGYIIFGKNGRHNNILETIVESELNQCSYIHRV